MDRTASAIASTLPTFGQWLTTYLRENEVMQTVFAGQIGITPQYLSDLARDRRRPSRRVVHAVAGVSGWDENVLSVIADLCPPMLRQWDIISLEVFFERDEVA